LTHYRTWHPRAETGAGLAHRELGAYVIRHEISVDGPLREYYLKPKQGAQTPRAQTGSSRRLRSSRRSIQERRDDSVVAAGLEDEVCGSDSSSASRVAAVGGIVVTSKGRGPEVLLVHGGASPETTWSPLAPLSRRWTLVTMHRRGYPPSPPPDRRQDFDVDADDLAPLLDSHPHAVAHSYGTMGALIAAARRPTQVRSLTLIEPPLAYLLPDDPDVARFTRIGEAVLTHGLETDPATLREFLTLAGAPGVDEGPLSDDVARGVRRAHGSRSPFEARPALDVLRDAGIPSLVASGDHDATLERINDAAATALGSQRLVAPGAGHFVAAAPGFADRLERFLNSVA
jgi:pimeloyl-ACP methyl ester carboxylesterase